MNYFHHFIALHFTNNLKMSDFITLIITKIRKQYLYDPNVRIPKRTQTRINAKKRKLENESSVQPIQSNLHTAIQPNSQLNNHLNQSEEANNQFNHYEQNEQLDQSEQNEQLDQSEQVSFRLII